jgi:lysyl-tRNA synthetase class 2
MTTRPVRSAVRDLSGLPEQQPVCVAGRIVAIHGDGFTLQDDTGWVHVTGSALMPLGALVQISARKDGLRLLPIGPVELLTDGNDRFTRADSEWGHLIGARLANLRKRQQLKRVVQSYFDTAGFLEVDTPAIVPCPGLDVHLDALEVTGMRAGARWLHTSPEYQMKRLLTTSLPGIYQLGKAFRRGEQGRLHEPEFTMLEWYRTFSDAETVMRDTEQLVAAAARDLVGSLVVPGSGAGAGVDVTPPWDRMSVEHAFERFAGIALADVLPDEEKYFQLLAERIEPQLGRERATFLTDYPARMASLAKLSAKDPRYAERFEAYIDGVELCNGFSELTDASEQRARFERDRSERAQLGSTVYPVDEYFMAALEEGIPPSGGNALGFDRLLMLLVGARHIDEVIALPASRM